MSVRVAKVAGGRLGEVFEGSARAWARLSTAADGGWSGAATVDLSAGGDPATHYVLDGVLTLRPALPDLPASTVAAGVALAGFPPGARVRVTDATLGIVAAEATLDVGQIVFPAPGAWLVEVLDAWPALPRPYSVTVT